MTHRLEPMLRPRSVAVIGASPREDSMGWWALENLRRGGFGGTVFAVNPGYDDIDGLDCFASVDELPETPDLAIFTVGDANIEAALDDAIAAGVPAAVIMSTLYLDGDTAPPLRRRIAAKVERAGMLVCGANGMGFYNVRDRVWACGFDSTQHDPPGNVAIISHSGSGMSGIIDCEQRLQINFAVSTGTELTVAMDEYLDFVLDLPETRVVGLFIESVRNPDGFREALAKANDKRIPVVALKVGRTQRAAALTESHSGALAGNDAAFDALFDRYGVQRVYDQDAWASALILFAVLHPVPKGGLVALHDSGGERQLLIDLCDELGVPLTTLSDDSVRGLQAVLDPELPAVNPLDAWSRGGPDAGRQMAECLALLMQDPGAALGAVVHARAPGGAVYPSYLEYLRHAREASGKPVALVAARQGTGHDDAVVTSTHAGYPVLDGVRPFLVGVRALFDFRDHQLRANAALPPLPKAQVEMWLAKLAESDPLSEFDSLALLEDFGIPTSRPREASSVDEAAAAAKAIGYPVVLKTASGAAHKTESGGVALELVDETALTNAYARITAR
ncbi:MAG: CoA-binding protein, partial [Woeseiaceae bacterium]|nr:CoA-binding protein [Woeseiaceae bacterium]